MKPRLFLLLAGVVFAAALFGLLGGSAAARPHGQTALAATAACGAGDPIVDVNQTVLNSVDIDATSSYVWAYDRVVNMRIRYWKTGDNAFCESRQIDGTFETVAGQSPAASGVVRAGITGTFRSVDAWTFTGAYDPGTHQTHGQLATIDEDCHIIDAKYYCTIPRGNVADGSAYYFPGGRGNLNLDSGYFYYDAGANGHWLQLGTRVFGDITG